MHAAIRRAIILTALPLLTAACNRPAGAPDSSPSATPTLLLTATPSPTLPRPTPTPRTRGAVCQFPVDYAGDGRLVDGGIYRFVWQGEPVDVTTGAGRVTVNGPKNLSPGARDLILIFNSSAPPLLELSPDLPPGGAVLVDPEIHAREFRTATGQVLRQRLDDPNEDGLFAINQDILRVERVFAPSGPFTLTVTLRGKRGIQLATRYEAWQVFLGNWTYEYRVLRNGTTESLWGAGQSPEEIAPEPVAFDGARLVYEFKEGSGESFGAASYTTAVPGDRTPMFPAQKLDWLYHAAYADCGP